MRQNHDAATSAGRWVQIAFLLIAAFFLFTEHRAHLFGVLPFLFLLPLSAAPHVHARHSRPRSTTE